MSKKKQTKSEYRVPGLTPIISDNDREAVETLSKERFRISCPNESVKLASLTVEPLAGTDQLRARSFFATGPNGAGISFTLRITKTRL